MTESVPKRTSPRVLLPARFLSNEEKGTTVEGVPAAYLDSVRTFGGMPLILPLHALPVDVERLCSLVDGFLIPGGEDINPALYNEPPHEKLGTLADARDILESQIVRYAREHKKPLLGICRGSQMMNVVCGGSLFQDLPSQRPAEPHHKISTWHELTDTLALFEGSKLRAVLQVSSIKANSLHHQAVKGVGHGLTVSATAEDGVVEGIEDASHPFFVGVQCHPEVLWQKVEPVWGRLFSSFIEACSATTPPKGL